LGWGRLTIGSQLGHRSWRRERGEKGQARGARRGREGGREGGQEEGENPSENASKKGGENAREVRMEMKRAVREKRGGKEERGEDAGRLITHRVRDLISQFFIYVVYHLLLVWRFTPCFAFGRLFHAA
jgi:hypothetical protein